MDLNIKLNNGIFAQESEMLQEEPCSDGQAQQGHFQGA